MGVTSFKSEGTTAELSVRCCSSKIMRVLLVVTAVLAAALASPIQYEMFDGSISGLNHDKPVIMRVTPEQHDDVVAYLKDHGMEHSLHIENLRTLIERELNDLKDRVPFNEGDHPEKITVNQYHTLDDILAYMNSVVSANPNLASIVNIGKSFQNRALTAIKIGNPGANKPAVWIDGGIHAREWISTATIVYIINELTTKQSQYSNLLSKIDVYLMPVVNSDGYAYTWTTDRMWRKTRSGPRSGCYGVDPNRNWDFKWMGMRTFGMDFNIEYGVMCRRLKQSAMQRNVCGTESVLRGRAQIGRRIPLCEQGEPEGLLQFAFLQRGWAAHTYPDDVNTIRAISAQAVAAIQAVNGERFSYGSITDIVYPASGSTIDYTRAVLNIDYSFGMELRPNGDASDGFVLPPGQIIAGASETWAGLMVVLNRVASGQ